MDDFKQKLYHYLHTIPEKEVISYGHLAKLAGQPNYARQVGRLLKQLPADTKLPWHRVVNAKMEVAFAEGSDKYLMQKQRLESEGWRLKGRRLILL